MSDAAADAPDAAVMESLLAFWADAGVDSVLLDAPVDRIAAGRILPPPRPASSTAAPIGARPSAISGGVSGATAADVAGAITDAAALARAAGDLDALQAAIAGFTGWPARLESGARPVSFRGGAGASVVVIGEAPDDEDERQGVAFSGASGRLLDRMLAAAKLEGRALITHAVFWRPPGGRPPSPAELAVCAPFLERLIQLSTPKLLLLLGAPAAQAVLKRDENIMALRGRWLEWRSSDGAIETPAMTMMHPAFLLKQPGAKKLAWSDLMALSERLDRPERHH